MLFSNVGFEGTQSLLDLLNNMFLFPLLALKGIHHDWICLRLCSFSPLVGFKGNPSLLDLLKNMFVFPLVGFKGNPSLLDLPKNMFCFPLLVLKRIHHYWICSRICFFLLLVSRESITTGFA